MKYHAFISYSHSADSKLAPALQNALEKFAKPWYKLRNLNIFLDEGSLAASPHLWSNIEEALRKSDHLIYMASPASASSKWVKKEIQFWLENKSVNTLFIALTEGEITWDDNTKWFMNPEQNSLPEELEKMFSEEPFYIDFRDSKQHKELSLHNPIFKKEVLKLAAPLHGKEPKDLASEEVSAHKTMMRLRNSIITVLAVLVVLASYAAYVAKRNGDEALSKYLLAKAELTKDTDPTLSLRLTEASFNIKEDDDNKAFALKLYRENNFYTIAGKHDKSLLSACISPNGKTVLTSSKDSTVCLWQTDGTLIKKINMNDWAVTAFSPDGSNFITGSVQGVMRLYNLNGDTIFSQQADSSAIYSILFSPDGKYAATCSLDKTVKLWDSKGNLQKVLVTYKSAWVNAVAFSPDSKTILTGASNKTAVLWNLDGDSIHVYRGHKGVVRSVAFSPDGKFIATGSDDKKARRWTLEGDLLNEYNGHTQTVNTVAFSPDGRMLMTGSSDKTVKLWYLKGNLMTECLGNTNSVSSAVFLPGGRSVLTGSDDGSARLFSLRDLRERELRIPSVSIKKLAASIDGGIVAATSDDSIYTWNENGQKAGAFAYDLKTISSLAVSPDGKLIAAGFENGLVQLLDLKGKIVQTCNGHSNVVSSVSFFPAAGYNFLASASWDSTVRIWNIKGETLQILKGHTGWVTSLAISKDGQNLYTGSWDRSVCIWDTNGKMIKEFKVDQSPVMHIAVSGDNTKIMAVLRNKAANLYDLRNGAVTELAKADDETFNSVSVSPDGTLFLSSSDDKIVRVRDLNGNIIQECKGHSGNIFNATFSSGGQTVLSAADDNTILYWKVQAPIKEFLKNNMAEPLSPGQKKLYGIKK